MKAFTISSFTILLLFSSSLYSQQQGFIIDATGGWQNTGYTINAGDSLTIISSGFITIWDFGTTNQMKYWLSPAGYGANYRTGDHRCATCPEGSLVGKISATGTPFFVGPMYYMENSQEAGELYLAVNDVATADNFGQFIAIVLNDRVTDVSLENQFDKLNYYLSQNYPNPFNPTTTIEYQVTSPQNITIDIFDINGKLVKNLVKEYKNSGNYTVLWNGTDNSGTKVSSATYFYQLSTDNYTQAKKMILIK